MTRRVTIKIDPKKTVEIELPSYLRVFDSQDQNGQSLRSSMIAPLTFADGKTGVIIIAKLTTDAYWQPVNDIKRIIIEKQ